MKLDTSPFSSAFYVLTGFHGTHVAFGILLLVGLWAMSLTGRVKPVVHAPVVENIGLYWHFVDIVWIVLFTAVYLIPAE
jgi:heme/copper-type cytochrome/quinol oxidase subunit 3